MDPMAHPSIVPVRDAWLARNSEVPLDPGLPIVDAHHHCLAFPDYRYYEEEFLADIAASGHNVVASVHAETGGRGRGCNPDDPEALRPVGETRALVEAAKVLPAGSPQISLGIVGFADLFLGAGAGETLDAHLESGEGRFRGIRQITPWDADPSLTPVFLHGAPHRLADPKFREGFAELARRSLSFDAWVYAPQIPDVIALADDFPHAVIVLDHCGTPVMQGAYARDRQASFAAWRGAIGELARRDNVFCKLGGLAKWICDLTFHQYREPPSSEQLASAWQPWIDACIAAFGPARCLFESNFPQEKPSCSYGAFWNACKRMTTGYSKDERAELFAGSAIRAYRLPLEL